jgi:hypothetical protein
MPVRKKATPQHDKMVEDLMQHFGFKLLRLISDIAETSQAGGLSVQECLTLLLSPIMKETVRLSAALGMDEKNFVKFAKTAYSKVLEDIEKNAMETDDE